MNSIENSIYNNDLATTKSTANTNKTNISSLTTTVNSHTTSISSLSSDLAAAKKTIPTRVMNTNNKITAYDTSIISITNSEVDDFGNRLTYIRLKAVVKSTIQANTLFIVGTVDSSFVCKDYTISGIISYGISVSRNPQSSVILVPQAGIKNDGGTGSESLTLSSGQICARCDQILYNGDSIYINFIYNLRQ